MNGPEERAALLRDQVKLTWNPPLRGRGVDADVAQTAVMQAMGFIMGKDFLGELTDVQSIVVTQGIEMMEGELL